MMLNVLSENYLVRRFWTAKFLSSLLESLRLRLKEQKPMPVEVKALVVEKVENVAIPDVVVAMVVGVDVADVQVVVGAAYVSTYLHFCPQLKQRYGSVRTMQTAQPTPPNIQHRSMTSPTKMQR